MSFSLCGLNHTTRGTFLGGKVMEPPLPYPTQEPPRRQGNLLLIVIPAKAGIHYVIPATKQVELVDSRFRGNDELICDTEGIENIENHLGSVEKTRQP